MTPPTFFGSDDIPALLADVGVDVTVGATTVKGIRDEVGAQAYQGDQGTAVGTFVAVFVQRGALPGLAMGGAIQVDGVDLIARSIQPIDDGALLRVELVEGPPAP